MLKAVELHARIGTTWPSVLAQLGVDESALRVKKPGPCPACGGRDRYTFDNRRGRGDFFCRGCGAGDGFALLMRVHRWTFSETLERVGNAIGANGPEQNSHAVVRPAPSPCSKPTPRVRELMRAACDPSDVPDAILYLQSRQLWPLAARCSLRAHASAEYWCERQRIGRFAALVADVRDGAGELVTVHVTYLAHGRKLAQHQPRKLLSPVSGRTGCAARLFPIDGDTIGIAEGLETAIAAHVLHEVPTWSALNTSLLAKFEPPNEVRTLVVFADRDAAGLEAAARLLERMQGRVRTELRLPKTSHKDLNDELMNRSTKESSL